MAEGVGRGGLSRLSALNSAEGVFEQIGSLIDWVIDNPFSAVGRAMDASLGSIAEAYQPAWEILVERLEEIKDLSIEIDNIEWTQYQWDGQLQEEFWNGGSAPNVP